MLVVDGQWEHMMVKSSDKDEGDRRDKFYNLFNTFCYKSKHAGIQLWKARRCWLFALCASNCQRSKTTKIFELPVFIKT